ncbi:MAG: ABC transporter permease [Clostridia bacterium]
MKSIIVLSLRSLKKNFVRTLITSIGIMLSVILLTSIIILFYSYKSSMIATTIQNKGDWHISIENDVDGSSYKSIEDKVDSYTKLKNLGYSHIKNVKNLKKPYLHIMAVDTNYPEMMPVSIVEGRFPHKNTEVVVPTDYAELYGVEIGSSLNLSLGDRMSEYGIRWQNASYLGEEVEFITNEYDAQYNVVGFCDTLSYMEYSFSPGYSILTYKDINVYDRAYIKLKNPKDALSLVDERSNDIILNKDLLDVLIIQEGESVGNAIRIIAVILVLLVLIVAFVLIYNSYMMTLNERSKEYLLLASIGATNKQLLLFTLVENLILGLLVVPISILIGIGLLKISFNTIVTYIELISYANIVFKLNITVNSILLIIGLGLAIILISSLVPFVLNLRKNIISGVRQNEIIRIKSNKTSKRNKHSSFWEFDFIRKNFKRYKNKYKFTIISILISIILFASMDIVLTTAKTQIEEEVNIVYDISCNSSSYEFNYAIDNIYKPMSEMKGINKSWWAVQDVLGYYSVTDNPNINEQVRNYVEKNEMDTIPINYVILNDNIFNELLIYMGEDFENSKRVIPAIAKITDYSSENFTKLNLFNKDIQNINLMNEPLIDNTIIENLDIKIIDTNNLNFPKVLYDYLDIDGIMLFMPLADSEFYLKKVPNAIKMFFECENHKYSYDQMLEFKKTNDLSIYINNHSNSYEKQLNTISIISLFIDIIMIIIIMISILNIFNTIFTNIIMRRKEFAILTSIGMLTKSLRRIVFLENFIILACALFISVCFTVLISFILKVMLGSTIVIYPIKKVLIIVIAYIVSLFTSCLFSFSIIKRKQIIDLLKNDK